MPTRDDAKEIVELVRDIGGIEKAERLIRQLQGSLKAAGIAADGTITGTSGILPSGMVVHTAAPAAPTGWLVCDGSAVSRTTYSGLFTAIGTTYGAGDGSTTFNLPQLIGGFVRGWDPPGGVGGSETHGHGNQTGTESGGALNQPGSSGTFNIRVGHDHTIFDDNHLPPYLDLLPIIKT